MSNPANWVVVGRFGRPYGIKGYVTVHSFTDPRDNILGYTNWHVFLHKQWQPLRMLDIKTQLKAIVALVEGYSERESVSALTNAEIAIHGEQLAQLQPGDYYWHELMGMQVVNSTGVSLGKVVDMMSTGSNDVLVVEGNKRHLIPYLPDEFVLDVSKEKRTITVDWDLDF